MSMLLVVDASFTIKLVLPNPEQARCRQLTAEWMQNGATLYAPTLWLYEVTSALTKAVHFDILTETEGRQALKLAQGLDLQLIQPDNTLVELAYDWTRCLNRAAAYEVALSSGRPYRAGERVVYYITGTDANVRGFENCKAAEEWDPNFPDENTAFYLRRLDELTEKFAEFFHPQDFRSIFSADELFPFESKGIVPLVTPVRPEAEEPPENERKRDFGIWLDQ